MSKYIITDPCYILEDDAWSACCKAAYVDKVFNVEAFNNMVKKQLELLSGHKAWVELTGYGDWSNSIYGTNDKVIQPYFCADSGTVCVCKLTKDVEDAIHKRFPAGTGELMAIIEVDSDVSVRFDTTNHDWTVVYIDASDCSFNSELPSGIVSEES